LLSVCILPCVSSSLTVRLRQRAIQVTDILGVVSVCDFGVFSELGRNARTNHCFEEAAKVAKNDFFGRPDTPLPDPPSGVGQQVAQTPPYKTPSLF
jgi:hypothetical protein